jgi:hypothetical protein
MGFAKLTEEGSLRPLFLLRVQQAGTNLLLPLSSTCCNAIVGYHNFLSGWAMMLRLSLHKHDMCSNQIDGMLSFLLLEAGVEASSFLFILLLFDCDDPSVEASSLLKMKHDVSSTTIRLGGTESLPLCPLCTKACPCISS